MDTRISGKTTLLGVFGMPVRHSGSPLMYNFCFNHYGLDCVYLAFECGVSQAKDTLAAMRRLNMRGANVTMPCKQEMARHMDQLSLEAGFIGAVNTIINDQGVLTGHVTDGKGVVLDLKDHGKTVKDQHVTLLGAGGAATAVMVQCALEGARSVTVFNRGKEGLAKAKTIGERMKADGVACRMEYHPLSETGLLHRTVHESSVLINATPAGMRPVSEGESLITDMTAFHEDLTVYDIIYNPPVTKLMSDAVANGCKKENVIGGKGMLLWQGAEAFKLFSGLDMPVRELKAFLARQEEKGTSPLRDIAPAAG